MIKATHYAENALLVIIGILTLAGAAEAIYHIYERRNVELQDLLLMFLYAEVLGMAAAYYESRADPDHVPGVHRDHSPVAACHPAKGARAGKPAL